MMEQNYLLEYIGKSLKNAVLQPRLTFESYVSETASYFDFFSVI